MELLTYSTDPCNALNLARVQLWAAKEVLAEANRNKDNEMKGRAMAWINRDRIALRELAYKLRSKLPAKKMYRIQLAASVTEFVIYEYAHSYQEAKEVAHKTYGDHFAIVSVEEVAKCQSAI